MILVLLGVLLMASAPESLTWSVPEAAKIVGLSKSSMYRLVHEGHVPTIRIAGRLLVPKKGLEEWLDEKIREAS